MKARARCRQALVLACMASTLLASAAIPPEADTLAEEEILDEVGVPAEQERQRQRRRARVVAPYYSFAIRRSNETTQVALRLRQALSEVRFRNVSPARRTPEQTGTGLVKNARLSDDRLTGFDRNSATAMLIVADNAREAAGPPASIRFGAHSALVNLEYLRLQDTRRQTVFSLANAINPQARRCEDQLLLIDDARPDSANRFVLLADSREQCLRVERSRTGGDLLIAEDLPERLRQDVLDVYGPIAVGMANRLGSEPGLVLVGWWPESPYQDALFEPSWERNSLLLFHGAAWQQGLDPPLRGSLRAAFAAEQIRRRFRHTDRPEVVAESAARYLLALFTAQQAGNTRGWLTGALPRWMAGCASHLDDRSLTAAYGRDLSSIDCAMVVQFVYDAVARARSTGRTTLFDSWRRLLDASFRRGREGVEPADFLASSSEARRIVRGLQDGTMDWQQFAADLAGLGVQLRIEGEAPAVTTTVLSLARFED